MIASGETPRQTIERYFPQLKDKNIFHIKAERFAIGLTLISFGLFKKVILLIKLLNGLLAKDHTVLFRVVLQENLQL